MNFEVLGEPNNVPLQRRGGGVAACGRLDAPKRHVHHVDMEFRRPSPEEQAEFSERVREEFARLAPALPGADPGNLLLILRSLMWPRDWERRYFLRRVSDSGHAL